jgi:hypothetical protein
MISSEVQRTLVKSPPELWAEISDPESLARHLGEFGEIRITRVEPEQRVEWEAGETSGSVVIKPSGWGTKVKLTVTRELDEQEPQDAPVDERFAADGEAAEAEIAIDAEASGDLHDAVEADLGATAATMAPINEDDAAPLAPDEPLAAEEQLEGALAPDPVEDAVPAEDPEPEPEPAPEPARRRGFFARLFGRRRSPELTRAERAFVEPLAAEPSDDDAGPPPAPRYNALSAWASQAAEQDGGDGPPPPQVAAELPGADVPLPGPAAGWLPGGDGAETADEASEAVVTADPEPESEATADAAARDLSAELQAAEDVAVEEVTAVLTGVLDRLGAAHHRPFSRA